MCADAGSDKRAFCQLPAGWPFADTARSGLASAPIHRQNVSRHREHLRSAARETNTAVVREALLSFAEPGNYTDPREPPWAGFEYLRSVPRCPR